jgi:DNA (cytosine-5)-methyltransferase 1
VRLRDAGLGVATDGQSFNLTTGKPHAVATTGVRRLTPVECERLMSWPDDWTAIDGADTPDSRRYAACGDGVVSNVAEWIAAGILREDAA